MDASRTVTLTPEFRAYLLDIRQARLAEVAAIEKLLSIEPTTAECRKVAKGKL